MVKETSSIKSIAKRYAKALGKMGAEVRYIVLFGSKAQSDARPDSDIDLAVISPDFKGKHIYDKQVILGLALKDIWEPVEPIGFSPEEFENPEPGSFAFEIKKTGKTVYNRKKARRE